jgi:hypothetical protein
MRRDCGRCVPKFTFQSVSVLLQELIRLPSIVNLEVFLRKFSDNYFQLGLREKQLQATDVRLHVCLSGVNFRDSTERKKGKYAVN